MPYKALKIPRSGATPRLHKFPPLRKTWMNTEGNNELHTPAELQQQLADGFQEGINKGFTQGLEEGKEEGYQEGARLGYDEGMKKGHREGKLAGKTLFDDAARPFEQLLQALEVHARELEARRREELLMLVEKVARQVIRVELTLHPTQLLTLVEEAIAGLPSAPAQLKVHLNPEEFARLQDVEPDKVREWGLTADAELELGECRIITETAEMDIGCQHRLDQCLGGLKSSLLPEDSHD